MAEETEVKIGKKSFISLEIFIMAVVMVFSLAMTWSSLNNSIEDNAKSIVSVQTQMKNNTAELKDIGDTLNSMLIESRINNELSKERMGDRWTASMEEEMWRNMSDYIRKFHPEFTMNGLPTVRDIQKQYGFRE